MVYGTTAEEQAQMKSDFNCSGFANFTENSTSNSRELFMKMSKYGRDQTGYDVGFVAASAKVCVKASEI